VVLRRAGALGGALLLACLAPTALAAAAAPPAPAQRAGQFLVSRQLSNGAWGSTDAASDQVADGVVGLVSAGVTDAPLAKALAYLSANAPADATRAIYTARIVLAIVAAGKNPHDFGHVDYAARLAGYYNQSSGVYDPSTDYNAVAILAALAAGDTVPPRAMGELRARQCGDGGFARSTCLFGTDVPTTALAVEALVASGAGPADGARANGRAYLLAAERPDGGFGMNGTRPTTPAITATVLSTIAALGDSPARAPWHNSSGNDPASALATFQDANGGIKPDGSTAPDNLTTARALPGLAGRALPVKPDVAAPATSTTVSPSPSTTVGVSTTVAKTRRGVTPKPASVASSTSTTTGQLGLAAPASGRRSSSSGRNLLETLPLVVTLFAAGTAGLVLRRRARL
jgi:hypothetical protein